MAGPALTTLADLAAVIAADAGENSASAPQSAFTTVGEVERARRNGPPSICWSVTGAKWEPAEQDEDALTRVCNQRVIRAEVEFLATDFDACSALVSHFGAAVFRTQSRHSARVVDETHARQPVSSIVRYAITLGVEYDLPVIFETATPAEVESTSQGGTVED
jgi:hypothetical protein